MEAQDVSVIHSLPRDAPVENCKMFGLKRLFEKTGIIRRSSDSISAEAERKAAAFIADMDKAILADMHAKGYALAEPAKELSLDEVAGIHEAERRVAIKVEVQRVAPATITFDPGANRATDAASGMAVEYVADDYPSERREFWKLIWKSREHDFRVDVGYGDSWFTPQDPASSASEHPEAMSKSRVKEYNVPIADLADPMGFLANIDMFLDLFAVVARNRLRSRNIDIIFKPWGVETRYYRHLRFAPLMPAER